MKAFSLKLFIWVALLPSSYSTEKVDPNLSLDELQKAIEAAQNSLSVIYNRFQLNEKIGKVYFYMSQNIDQKGYNFVKYQFARKITSSESEEYRMTFGGSSVTAGHDNQYTQSYPEVVGRKIRPVLESFGIPTLIHNVAQGANGCFPSNYCYESMGGFDPDFVGWEQSFNCGHSGDMFETAARFALWSKNPGLVYYSQSGSINGGAKCPESKVQPPRCREEWNEEVEKLTPWKPTQTDVHSWRDEFFRSFGEIGSTTTRFGGAAFSYQRQGAPMAVSGSALWDNHPDSVCAGTGLPPKTCSAGAIAASCDLTKYLSKECALYGSAGGNGARWHPTIATHLYRGELISWLLLISLLDALYMIQDDVTAGVVTKSALYSKYTTEYESLYPLKKMPTPKYCGGAKYCETKPKCFTDYHPHFAPNMSLSELIVGTHHWSNTSPTLAALKLPDVEHVEGRPGFSATEGVKSGEIHFKVTIGNYKSVVVCGYHSQNFYAAAEFTVELNVPEARLTNYVPGTQRSKWLHVVDAGGCAELSNFPSGTHVISLVSKVNELRAQAGLSHVITWD